ncbi:hypothetical protein QWA_17380 [Alcaligenes faecalis subsp. faecalis NCIB 8687]|nr:hypothetical protein QWA_17380 [Alcaligenes faecalis subsp. faecalis NCIB 8687]
MGNPGTRSGHEVWRSSRERGHCVNMLSGPTGGPEKRLADLNADHLMAQLPKPRNLMPKPQN